MPSARAADAAELRPREQTRQPPPPLQGWYRPAAQGAQALAAEGLLVPAGQATHALEVLAVDAGEALPAPQLVHQGAPAEDAYEPAEQEVQDDAPVEE